MYTKSRRRADPLCSLVTEHRGCASANLSRVAERHEPDALFELLFPGSESRYPATRDAISMLSIARLGWRRECEAALARLLLNSCRSEGEFSPHHEIYPEVILQIATPYRPEYPRMETLSFSFSKSTLGMHLDRQLNREKHVFRKCKHSGFKLK